jgi:hypothetical protein
MSSPDTARPAPRIIHIPPPAGLGIPSAVLTIGAVVFLVLGLVALVLALALTPWLLLGGVPALLGAALLAWWAPKRRLRRTQRRTEYVASMRQPARDPVAGEIAEKWANHTSGVSDDVAQSALKHHAAADETRAQVLCLGTFDVSEVGEEFFEPEIIAPTRYIGWKLMFVPFAALVIAIWFLQVIDVIHLRRTPLPHYGYIVMMGVGAGIAWFRRAVLQPTYIRMAPGVIQILEYRFRKGKPTIRSYPMDHETTAILRGRATEKKPCDFRVTLLRGQQQDSIDVARMRGREIAAQRIWQALLSTAPTPPLSNENLVG